MINFQGKKVLVTGASGFIGSHLSEQLVQEGAQVRALVHYNSSGRWGNLEHIPESILNEIEIVQGDVTDSNCAHKVTDGCEIVFHLAALIAIPYSYRAPQSYVMTNIMGSLNMLQAARDSGVKKLVHTSTSETYGTALYTPIDENHPLQGQSPYSASKIGADKIAESFHLSFGLPVATIRPFNTFGPRQSARAVIPTIIAQVLGGDSQIKLGSLTPVRDFTFVKDTVDGFCKVALSEKSVGKLINIGTGKGICIGDLANQIIALCGTKATVSSDDQRIRPENSEVMNLLCDNTQALQILDWKPKRSLEQGLLETIEFIRKNQSLYKPKIYNV